MEEIVKRQTIDKSMQINCVAVEFPAKLGSQLMKYLANISIVNLHSYDLGHLKRISKKPNSLCAVLYPCDTKEIHSSDAIQDIRTWEKLVQDIQEKFPQAQIIQVKVPKYPAESKEECAVKSKQWPLIFHPKSKTENMVCTTGDFDTLSDTEVEEMIHYMEKSMDDFKCDDNKPHLFQNAGCFTSGCIIVDPTSKKIIASTSKYRKVDVVLNPLSHAVLRCISVIADRDYSSDKRKKVLSGASEGSSTKNAQVEKESYICTGYDLYTVMEPCTMCAMSLIHSRIRRVIYACSNEVGGGLGTNYFIHTIKSLNHRYRVFQAKSMVEKYTHIVSS